MKTDVRSCDPSGNEVELADGRLDGQVGKSWGKAEAACLSIANGLRCSPVETTESVKISVSLPRLPTRSSCGDLLKLFLLYSGEQLPEQDRRIKHQPIWTEV